MMTTLNSTAELKNILFVAIGILAIIGVIFIATYTAPTNKELSPGAYKRLFYTIDDECPKLKPEVVTFLQEHKVITVGKEMSLQRSCKKLKSAEIIQEFMK